MNWNPDAYLGFHDLRLRPAIDLLARVRPLPARSVIDLGCGPGNLASILSRRWPDASLTGVDQSAEMLARAREVWPSACWIEADLAGWAPAERADVVFSNAALHWLNDHENVFSRLADLVADEGVLAVQMPANFEAPSHRLIRDLAKRRAWVDALEGARMGAVLGAADYHRLLATRFRSVDVWETTYYQQLGDIDAVLQWLGGTTLIPYISRLDAEQGRRFVAELRELLAAAYPLAADGTVVFPFKRVFMVAEGPLRTVSRGTT